MSNYFSSSGKFRDKVRLSHSSRFRNLPFPLRCFAVDQLFPGKQIEPQRELLVTVVNDAGVDREGPRDFRRCDLNAEQMQFIFEVISSESCIVVSPPRTCRVVLRVFTQRILCRLCERRSPSAATKVRYIHMFVPPAMCNLHETVDIPSKMRFRLLWGKISSGVKLRRGRCSSSCL